MTDDTPRDDDGRRWGPQHHPHLVRVDARTWVVIDGVREPRYVIRHRPLVYRPTGETHIMYDVTLPVFDDRAPTRVGVWETLRECLDEIRHRMEPPPPITEEQLRESYRILAGAFRPPDEKRPSRP